MAPKAAVIIVGALGYLSYGDALLTSTPRSRVHSAGRSFSFSIKQSTSAFSASTAVIGGPTHEAARDRNKFEPRMVGSEAEDGVDAKAKNERMKPNSRQSEQQVCEILEQATRGPQRPRLPWSRQSREERRTQWATRRKTDTPSSAAVESLQASGLPKHLAHGGVVLVTGATGGVGKRVVEELRRRGLPVRALVRNKSKGLAMLVGDSEEPQEGSGLDIAVGDIRDMSSLRPSIFQGVSAVISCTAAIVQPKEGDGPDRAKYFQGIVFYEPEVADIPEETEFVGVSNLLTAVSRYSDVTGKVLYGCLPSFQERWKQWGALDDVVMGGVSESSLRVVPGAGEAVEGVRLGGGAVAPGAAAVFSGEVCTANSGGFVSVRTRNSSPPLDLSSYDALSLRVKGDGNRYKFTIYDSPGWSSKAWCTSFDTVRGEWIDVTVPFDTLIYNFRTKTVEQPPPFESQNIFSFQLMLSKFELDGNLNPSFSPGAFSLTISSIKALSLKDDMEMPRFVHLSSAGVTRPGKPGLDFDGEPPAVRMNDMLSYLLTYKLKGEDAIRSSGIPATIIRPCALTEEAAGAPMIVAQGDDIKGKISRNDIAELAAECLTTPEATGLTFEVKSDLAFSTRWEAKEEDMSSRRNYRELFSPLDKSITGKEWMGDKSPEEAAGLSMSAPSLQT